MAKTECSIRMFSNSSGGGTNVWITHEGVCYYSRLNSYIEDTPAQRNLQIAQFLNRRKMAENAAK